MNFGQAIEEMDGCSVMPEKIILTHDHTNHCGMIFRRGETLIRNEIDQYCRSDSRWGDDCVGELSDLNGNYRESK